MTNMDAAYAYFLVYVEQGRSSTATFLKFTTGDTGGGSWKMKVSQIGKSIL